MCGLKAGSRALLSIAPLTRGTRYWSRNMAAYSRRTSLVWLLRTFGRCQTNTDKLYAPRDDPRRSREKAILAAIQRYAIALYLRKCPSSRLLHRYHSPNCRLLLTPINSHLIEISTPNIIYKGQNGAKRAPSNAPSKAKPQSTRPSSSTEKAKPQPSYTHNIIESANGNIIEYKIGLPNAVSVLAQTTSYNEIV